MNGMLRPGEKVVDLFCGCGGWTASRRLHDAGIHVDYAVNHSPEAIKWHAANNPGCKHYQGDAWKAMPREVTGDDTIGLLLASAACTTHSNARGAAPISPRVHMLGWCIARWITDKRPRIVEVENVSEWQKWGPLVPLHDGRGRVVRDETTGKIVRIADKAREGTHFRKWLRYCKRAGYAVEHRVLDAADFGNASRRKRLFVKMRCDGAAIAWPAPTHAAERDRGGSLFTGSLLPHRAAAEIIDWSDLGRSIYDGPRNSKSYRGTRLAKKTLARTCEGIGRFVLEAAKPFTLRVTHGHAPEAGWHVAAIDQPTNTQTTRQDIGVVTPVIAKHFGGPRGSIGHRIDHPTGTITTVDHHSLVAPVLATTRNGERTGQRLRTNSVDAPLNTIVNGPTQGIASAILLPAGGPECNPSSVADPLGTVLTRDHRGVAVPVMMAQRNHANGSDVRHPDPALCSGGTHNGLATPVCVEFYGQSTKGRAPTQRLGCVTTLDRHSIATPCLSEHLTKAMRTRAIRLGKLLRFFLKDRVRLNAEGMALAVVDGVEFLIVDILFRMLRPRELARAMGFPDSFALPAVQRDAVRLIGNAVAVPMAEALIMASLPGMFEPTPLEAAA